MKRLAQLKIDARNNGWPWPITHPNDERALVEGCYPDFASAMELHGFFRDLLTVPREHRRTIDGVRQKPLKPFALLGWWFRDVLAPLYGWKKASGSRRFDKGFITTGKKSAKSTVLSGLPLFTITEGTQQAEAYTTAVDRNQAGIVYSKTSWACMHSELDDVLKRIDSQKRIVHRRSGSWFQVLSPDKDSSQGRNPNLLICDELHAWRDREFFEAVMYGDISRENALLLMITTAGDDAESIGYEEYEFARDLLDPANPFYSQNHFAFIAEADKEKEWDDPEGWKQANPSLACGAIGSIEKLQGKASEVAQSPRKKRAWQRYICNRWVLAVENPWLDSDRWKACRQAIPDHHGDPCWLGLDLAKTQDLATVCAAWWDGEYLDLQWWVWTPEETVREHEHQWRAPLRDWIADGWIIATPGARVDYRYIRQQISGVTLDDAGEPVAERWAKSIDAEYQIQEIRHDPYNATELCETQLDKTDGLEMVPHRQGYLSMNGPCKAFEGLVIAGKLRTGGNPVADWCASHCVAPPDPSDNIKLDKKKSRHKIDLLVAAVMAVGGAIAGDSEQSVYATDEPFYADGPDED